MTPTALFLIYTRTYGVANLYYISNIRGTKKYSAVMYYRKGASIHSKDFFKNGYLRLGSLVRKAKLNCLKREFPLIKIGLKRSKKGGVFANKIMITWK